MTSTTHLDELEAALALSRRPGVGASSFYDLLIAHHTPLHALAHAPPLAGHPDKVALDRECTRALERVARGELQATYLTGPGYPPLLHALGEPPPVIFARGDLATLSRPQLAVVGSRDVSADACERARAIAHKVAAGGWVVTSGGAKGVDAAAHEGALEAGGHTVIVAGGGVDVPYPRECAGLFDRAAGQGVVVSEFLPGTAPRASFFVTRNRIIAALCAQTVLVAGRRGSGALGTVRWAARLGRPVSVVAWPDGHPMRAACDEARAMLAR